MGAISTAAHGAYNIQAVLEVYARSERTCFLNEIG